MNDFYSGIPADQLRIPPQAIQSEQSVLGGLLLTGKDTFDVVADIIAEDDFYRHDHQLIFRAIKQASDAGKPYDSVTIGEWFESMGMESAVDGGAYLIELASNTPSAANIAAYARIVKEKSTLRRMIDVGTQIINDGFSPEGQDVTDLLAKAESAVMAVSGLVADDVISGDDALRDTVAELSRRRKLSASDLLGATTSLDAVDALTYGLQPGDLIVLAARPSMGKTAMMLQMMRAAAMDGHRPYGIELEMGKEQTLMRQIAAVGRVDFGIVQRPSKATEDDMARVRGAVSKLRGLEWWMDFSPGMTIDQIAAKLRRMKRQKNISIAFIDYLQYIDTSRQLRYTNATGAIQEITRRLKGLAKELGIPIVLLSQLNRGLEQRRDKRPILSDLRESGAIEQDADVVIFLHREAYYDHDIPKDDPRQKLAEVIVAKSRNGVVGSVNAHWEGKYQLFGDISYNDPLAFGRQSYRGGFEPERKHGILTPNRLSDDED